MERAAQNPGCQQMRWASDTRACCPPPRALSSRSPSAAVRRSGPIALVALARQRPRHGAVVSAPSRSARQWRRRQRPGTSPRATRRRGAVPQAAMPWTPQATAGPLVAAQAEAPRRTEVSTARAAARATAIFATSPAPAPTLTQLVAPMRAPEDSCALHGRSERSGSLPDTFAGADSAARRQFRRPRSVAWTRAASQRICHVATSFSDCKP